MYTPIDINNWNRRELFQHFSQMKMPHFIVAANVDVTRLLAYKRASGLSFYLSLIYLSTEVLNSIDNFHLRFEQGQVVSYDRIHTNFTHKRAGEDVFRYHTAPLRRHLAGVRHCHIAGHHPSDHPLRRAWSHPKCGLFLVRPHA